MEGGPQQSKLSAGREQLGRSPLRHRTRGRDHVAPVGRLLLLVQLRPSRRAAGNARRLPRRTHHDRPHAKAAWIDVAIAAAHRAAGFNSLHEAAEVRALRRGICGERGTGHTTERRPSKQSASQSRHSPRSGSGAGQRCSTIHRSSSSWCCAVGCAGQGRSPAARARPPPQARPSAPTGVTTLCVPQGAGDRRGRHGRSDGSVDFFSDSFVLAGLSSGGQTTT